MVVVVSPEICRGLSFRYDVVRMASDEFRCIKFGKCVKSLLGASCRSECACVCVWNCVLQLVCSQFSDLQGRPRPVQSGCLLVYMHVHTHFVDLLVCVGVAISISSCDGRSLADGSLSVLACNLKCNSKGRSWDVCLSLCA